MSIKLKFSIVFGTLALALAIVSFGAFRFVDVTSTSLEDLGKARLTALQSSQSILNEFRRYNKDVEIAISIGEPSLVKENAEVITLILQKVEELGALDPSLDVSGTSAIIRNFKGAVESYSDLVTKSDNPDDILAAGKLAADLRIEIDKVLEESAERANLAYQSRLTEMHEYNERAAVVMGAAAAVLVFLVVIISGGLLRNILNRVEMLANHFSSTDDLAEISPLALKGSNDELEILVKASNRMLDGFRESRTHLVEREFVDDIFNTLVDILFVTDSTGKITRTNKRGTSQLNVAEKELVGMQIRDLAADEVSKVEFDVFVECLGEGRPAMGELEVKTGPDTSIPVYISGRPMEAKNQGQQNFVVVLHDLTDIRQAQDEKRQVEKQLLQASKLASLGTLGAGVAHELNNPLVGVRGFAEIIQKAKEVPERYRDAAQKIFKATQRMQKIIDHLRTFSADSTDREWKEFDINEVIEDSLTLLNQQLSLKGIAVEKDLAEDAPIVTGNANQVESIVQNLIANARDVLDELPDNHDKRVFVSTRKLSGNQLEVRVGDSGSGIPPELKEKIFDPFFTTKDVGKGTGIGLSISHGIIVDHGGSIEVGDRQGGGAEFVFVLPGQERTSKVMEKIRPASVASSDKEEHNALKIAIVDDEELVGDVLSIYLDEEHETTLYTDPVEACDKIAAGSFDMVITDMRMPKRNGLEVIDHVKASHPDMPIIVITGHAKTEADVEEAIARGAMLVIPKPFPPADEVLSTINDCYQLWQHTLIRGNKSKPAAQVSEPATESNSAQTSGRKHVLVIDDEEQICEILFYTLEEEYTVTTTTNPKDALDKIATDRFDVILTDLSMPKVSGHKIIESVVQSGHDTAIIVMTGSGKNSAEVQRAFDLGAHNVLTKPFLDLNVVGQLIEDTLADKTQKKAS